MQIDPQIASIAATAVTALVPFLKTGATELAKKLGSSAGERLTALYDRVKARLSSTGREALADLEQAPDHADSQAALRQQLSKQLAADPSLHAVLAELVEALQSRETAWVLQTSTIIGDHDTNIQISGSGNQVSGFGRPS
jgi:hypothetical protein